MSVVVGMGEPMRGPLSSCTQSMAKLSPLFWMRKPTCGLVRFTVGISIRFKSFVIVRVAQLAPPSWVNSSVPLPERRLTKALDTRSEAEMVVDCMMVALLAVAVMAEAALVSPRKPVWFLTAVMLVLTHTVFVRSRLCSRLLPRKGRTQRPLSERLTMLSFWKMWLPSLFSR
jgi:hypothetical protein